MSRITKTVLAAAAAACLLGSVPSMASALTDDGTIIVRNSAGVARTDDGTIIVRLHDDGTIIVRRHDDGTIIVR